MFRKHTIALPQYFIYVSDAKVDMLLPQIPRKVLKSIAAELTVDFKVLSVKLSQKPAEEDRFSRAMAVSRFLQRAGEVGSLNEEKAYVQVDAMRMVWGHFRGSGPSSQDRDPGVVLFLSQFGNERVCLSGSLHHVLGAAPGDTMDRGWYPGSFAVPPSAFTDSLYRLIEDATETVSDDPYDARLGTLSGYYKRNRSDFERADKLSFMARVTHRYRESGFSASDVDYKVTLGSPIWVSLANA